jgi:Na+-translocating ferredoxin:NAD+ oxidoreductase RnfA subunit
MSDKAEVIRTAAYVSIVVVLLIGLLMVLESDIPKKYRSTLKVVMPLVLLACVVVLGIVPAPKSGQPASQLAGVSSR